MSSTSMACAESVTGDVVTVSHGGILLWMNGHELVTRV